MLISNQFESFPFLFFVVFTTSEGIKPSSL
nr:MAG TPA: hypothetical protein [Caudoviricetes sp.]